LNDAHFGDMSGKSLSIVLIEDHETAEK